MKLTSMKAALAVMFAGTVLVSCGNEGPNLKGNLKMDRDTEEKWKNGVAEHGLPWTNLYNGNGKEIVTAYGVQGYPTKIIIDPEGKIVAKFAGEDPAMYKKLDELF